MTTNANWNELKAWLSKQQSRERVPLDEFSAWVCEQMTTIESRTPTHTCEHSGAKVPVEGLRPDTKDAISRVASVVCQRGDYLELSTELDCFARAIIAEVERRGCGGSERSEEVERRR